MKIYDVKKFLKKNISVKRANFTQFALYANKGKNRFRLKKN